MVISEAASAGPRAAASEGDPSGLSRRERRKLEVLLGNLPGMAYRCNASRRRKLELVSKGCVNLTGYRRSQLLNDVKHWDALIDDKDRRRVRNSVKKALARKNGPNHLSTL